MRGRLNAAQLLVVDKGIAKRFTPQFPPQGEVQEGEINLTPFKKGCVQPYCSNNYWIQDLNYQFTIIGNEIPK